MRIHRWAVPLAAIGLTLASSLTPAAASVVPPGGGGINFAGQDPYASGCASHANMISQGEGGGVTVENWFSTSCDTNWAVLTWNSSDSFNGHVAIFNSNTFPEGPPLGATESTHLQCFPEDCAGNYTGSPSMWTNMVEGIDVACIQVDYFIQGTGIFGGGVGMRSSDVDCR